MSADRGGTSTSASPDVRSIRAAARSSGACSARTARSASVGEGHDRVHRALDQDIVARAPGRRLRRPGAAPAPRRASAQVQVGRVPRPSQGEPSRTRSRTTDVGQAVLLHQRPSVAGQVGRDGRRGARGQQPLTEEHARSRSCPPPAGCPRARMRRTRSRPRPRRRDASTMSTWTGVPVSARSDPACAPNTSGIISCDGGRPSRTAITTTTGSSAATAPLTLMSAVSSAHDEHHQHDQPRPAVARPARSAAGPPRSSRRSRPGPRRPRTARR